MAEEESYRDKGYYHTIRCSKFNPQHIKVQKVLDELNPDVFKSKNQYIIDAIEWYDRYLNEQLGEQERNYVAEEFTKAQIDRMKEEIITSVMFRVQSEIITLLGTALSGGQRNAGNIEADMPLREPDNGRINEKVAEMANYWGSDEE